MVEENEVILELLKVLGHLVKVEKIEDTMDEVMRKIDIEVEMVGVEAEIELVKEVEVIVEIVVKVEVATTVRVEMGHKVVENIVKVQVHIDLVVIMIEIRTRKE